MAGEVTVDALPYIDQGYDDPGVRESALAMVEEECRRYRPTKNYLDHLPQLNTSAFETKLMGHEFDRIQNRLPMEQLSMKRYELPPPSASKMSEISAWQEAIENSMAQLEHQAIRAMNLELMLEYGCEAWKAYLEIFTSLQAKAQLKLQELKKEIQDVNWQRKVTQTQAGEKLRSLEAHWVMLVSKNYEIEQECVEMQNQIAKLEAIIGIHNSNDNGVNDESNEDYIMDDNDSRERDTDQQDNNCNASEKNNQVEEKDEKEKTEND